MHRLLGFPFHEKLRGGRWQIEISRYGVYYIYHKKGWEIEVVEEEKRYPNKSSKAKNKTRHPQHADGSNKQKNNLT